MGNDADNGPLLFALNSSRALGEAVAGAAGTTLADHEEREFEDGEHKIRPLISVRGRDVYVIASLYSVPQASVNDKLVRLLFFIGALRDAGAQRLTAVIPYLCYARKDRRTQPRDPVTTRYVAAVTEALGVDAVMVMDVHNLAAYQNAWRCRSEHLEATPLFVDHFASLFKDRPVVVVSPDAGGAKRADRLRKAMSRRLGVEVPLAFMEKQRAKGVVSGDKLVGEVEGRAALMIDDMIGTGHTLMRAAHALRRAGAQWVAAAATHGLFYGEAEALLRDPALDQLVVTDTVPPFRLSEGFVEEKVVVLPASALIGEAIARLHAGGSLVELLHAE